MRLSHSEALERLFFYLCTLFPITEREMLRIIVHTASRPRLIFLTVTLLVIVATSTRPDQFSYQARLKSFSGDPSAHTLAEPTAQAGFHRDGNGARCFHCADRHQPPNQQHNCHLQRLLSGISPWGSEAQICDSMRFQALMDRLDGALTSSMVRTVESYGFSTNEAARALLRHLIRERSFQLPERPGDLIQMIHDLPPDSASYSSIESDLLEVYRSLAKPEHQQQTRDNTPEPLESSNDISINPRSVCVNLLALQSTGKPAAPSPSSPRRAGQTTQPPAANPVRLADPVTQPRDASAEAVVQQGADDPNCILCREREIDCVTIPCRHLVACRACLDGMTVCPGCGAIILGKITAHLSRNL